MRGRLLIGAATCVLVGLGALLLVHEQRISAVTRTSSPTAGQALATVQFRDLRTVVPEPATLGFGDPRALSASRQGTLTALPASGSVISRGDVLYRVDNRPVVLLFGRVPAWRSLGPATSPGPDILQLKRNLVRLGDDPRRQIRLDDHWGWATTLAVKRWQKGLNQPQTGVVALGDVDFLPGPRRVGALTVSLGAQDNGTLYTTTSSERIATIALDARQQSLAKLGAHVAVRLPSGRIVAGTIDHVASVAAASSSSAGSSPAIAADLATTTPPATINVVVRLAPIRALTALDGAPAVVTLTTARVHHALAVPVTALLALAGSGFGLELAANHQILPVVTGVYAGGYVQVAGAIHAGLHILAAAQ